MMNFKFNINFVELKARALQFLRALIEKIREILKLPYAKLYIAITVPMILLFIVMTFPYDVLIRGQLKKMESGLYRSIQIGDLSYNVIGESTADNVVITLNSGGELSLKEINSDLSLNPFTLFVRKKLVGGLQINGFKYNRESSQVDFNINGNLDLNLNPDYTPAVGTIKFMIQNANIRIGEINLPDSMGGLPLTIPPIKIPSVIFNSNISGQRLNLQTVKINGTDLRGEIQGNVMLDRILMNSKLNIKILVDPNSEALARYRDMIAKFSEGKGMITIPVSGTISNPRVEMPQQ